MSRGQPDRRRGIAPAIGGGAAEGHRPGKYRTLRRRMTLLMILVTVVPLTAMALINFYEHRKVLREQIVSPTKVLLNRTRHSCELFLAERRSAVSFIASTYSFEQLSDPGQLLQVFQVMKREFGGFVDLGLIDSSGLQVSYAGPYQLVGKDYTDQDWFEEVTVRGAYTSEVFKGHRRYPHFVIAVQHVEPTGRSWIVRATIDTEIFNSLIECQDRSAGADAFVVNRQNILQTPSCHYGSVLEPISLTVPDSSEDPALVDVTDPQGRKILLGYVAFQNAPFTLVVTAGSRSPSSGSGRSSANWSTRTSSRRSAGWRPASPTRSTTPWPSSTRRRASWRTCWNGNRNPLSATGSRA